MYCPDILEPNPVGLMKGTHDTQPRVHATFVTTSLPPTGFVMGRILDPGGYCVKMLNQR